MMCVVVVRLPRIVLYQNGMVLISILELNRNFKQTMCSLLCPNISRSGAINTCLCN